MSLPNLKWSQFFDEPNKRTAYRARLLAIDFEGFRWEWVLYTSKVEDVYILKVGLETNSEPSPLILIGERHPNLIDSQIAAEMFLDGLIDESRKALQEAAKHSA